MVRANFNGAYGHNLQLEVVSEGYRQDIAGNFSVINVQVRLISNGYAAIYDGANKSLAITVGGETRNVTVDAAIGQNQNKLIFDNEFRVPHDQNGTKTVNINARLDINVSGYGSASVGFNRRLPDIPRASSGYDVTAVIGQPVTININRKNDAFKHAIWATYGSFNKQITTTNVDTSFVWTPPLELCEQTPDSASGYGNLTIITYDGSREIGRDIKRLNLSIPDDVKPTLTGFTLTDGNTIAANIVSGGEHFIKILSDIRVNFGAASGVYGSTITGYYAEIVGKNQSTTTNGGGLGLMNYDGQSVIRARVTDSRGRTSNAIERTVTILDYFPPILKFDVARTGLNGGTLTITRTAKVAPLIVNGSQKNKMTLTFKVKPLADKSYTSDTGPAAGSWTSISELVNSPANLSGQYPANKTWEIVGKLEDRYTSTEFAAIITTEGVVISYSQFGVGINKIWERGALDVKGDIYVNDKLIQMHALTQKNGTAIYAYGKDFDQERTTGVYFKNGTENNNPARQYGWLLVLNSNNECFQMFFPSIATAEPAKRVLLAGKWSAWSTNARSDHANLKRIEWTSTGVTGVHYKRQGDIVSLRIEIRDVTGNVSLGRIPNELTPIRGNAAMLNVPVFEGGSSNDRHLQINPDGGMTLLASNDKYIGTQINWSI
jgi:putative minor structural protein